MNDLLIKCSQCNGKLELTLDEGAIQIFTCSHCGYEVSTHVSLSVDEMMVQATDRNDLFVDWISKPTVKEIMLLRKVFNEFKSISIMELVEKWEIEKRWYLGCYKESEAEELKASAQIFGLNVIVNSKNKRDSH